MSQQKRHRIILGMFVFQVFGFTEYITALTIKYTFDSLCWVPWDKQTENIVMLVLWDIYEFNFNL